MSSRSPSGKTILVIEDNPTSMDLMIFLLNSMGHLVLPALNGPAGLAIAKAQRPSLVLCDIQMPSLDGYGVLEAIRSDASMDNTRVVAVTAMAMVGDKQKLLSSGFDGYVGKPIDLHELRDEVDKHLGSRT
jgi:CheY-like chemotaxis protein